jgi:NTE family protein
VTTTRRPRRGRRLGLALAGGGPEGAVYELGALRALEEAIEGLDATQADVYVGVSAGAFVASALANGMRPAQLVRGLVIDRPGEAAFDPGHFFVPAYREWARRSARIPVLLAEALLQFTKAPGDQTLFESLARLGQALPPGLFDNEPIHRYLEALFRQPGRTNDFRKLRHRLFVIAADLEAGTPIVFGAKGLDRVPISRAVQASTALPGLYPPVTIDGRLCVDGVLLKTVHASTALEQGVGLLLCVNPLVPVDVAAGERLGALEPGALLRGGLPALLSQTFRTLIHSRMVVGMARYEGHYPGQDVALFEPERSEYRLFFRNIFSFRARREMCEIAYETTRKDLWRRRRTLGPMLRRHGFTLNEDVLADSERSIWAGVGLAEPGRRSGLAERLTQILERLEANGRKPARPARRARAARA